RPLVLSVCKGFKEGFWPWATTKHDYPQTWDNSHRPLRDETHYSFLREQRDEELKLKQYSEAFGPNLLPRMYSEPIGVVPKPHSNKLRLVNDLSAGKFSLNSMIPLEEGTVKLDGMRSFGRILRRARLLFPHEPLTLFKSDISRAYRLLPMHPLWQIKQIVTIDGMRHVDRCNCFGGRTGCRLFFTFMCLVLWIADHVFHIKDLLAYVDDTFSWEFSSKTLFYPPYQTFFPWKQTKLLMLWDDLGIPHEFRKQVHGQTLTIIGFNLNTINMTLNIDPEKKAELLQAIELFCAKTKTRHTLRDFQRLAGWINWALNAQPRLRPGLASLYSKIAGKQDPYGLIWVNCRVKRDLHWIAKNINLGTGIHLLEAIAWGPTDADLTIYTDASPLGYGFWTPKYNSGFHAPLPEHPSQTPIFFFEAYAVCAALWWAITTTSTTYTKRIAIFTDNTNTVQIFNTLKAHGIYNKLLLFTSDLLIESHADLRVYHIPGVTNKIADMLSRHYITALQQLYPTLVISQFTLPATVQGALAP
ncbi:MAG TPA: hypothetical protein VGO47_12490, partial [Chlamydiales bacterium]|nr:hypothetical protein [Chlamydiales bacterium]